MQVPEPLTEVILVNSHKSLGKIQLTSTPQPGTTLEMTGQTYAILERHHRYQFRAGRYRLHQIFLYVQPIQNSHEQSWVDGRWVLGNASCRFNAHSEIIRCAVYPQGPCEHCYFYEVR